MGTTTKEKKKSFDIQGIEFLRDSELIHKGYSQTTARKFTQRTNIDINDPKEPEIERRTNAVLLVNGYTQITFIVSHLATVFFRLQIPFLCK